MISISLGGLRAPPRAADPLGCARGYRNRRAREYRKRRGQLQCVCLALHGSNSSNMQCSTRRQSSQDVAVVISTCHDCLFHCVISDEIRRTPHSTGPEPLYYSCAAAVQQHCEHDSSTGAAAAAVCVLSTSRIKLSVCAQHFTVQTHPTCSVRHELRWGAGTCWVALFKNSKNPQPPVSTAFGEKR